jgi:hypothetical protein
LGCASFVNPGKEFTVTDPANPGQPYGAQPGEPYAGQQAYGGQPPQPGPSQPGPPQPGPSQPGPPQPGPSQPGPPPAPGSPYSGYSGEAPAPNPYGGAPVPPPAKKSKAGKIIGIIAGVVVLLIVICVGALFAGGSKLLDGIKNDPANAKVGNCLAGDKLDSSTAKPVSNVKVVDCTSSTANYKVVGVVNGKTQAQFNADDNVCKDFATAQSALWQGTAGKAGSVLCLEPIKK